MSKWKFILSAALLMMLVAGMLPGAGRTFAQATIRTFPETGKTVSGKILEYWNAHGGVAALGLPISDQVEATSPTDGKKYTLQYFERSVLEIHPENAGTPFEVLGSLLGVFYYSDRYLIGVDAQKAITTNAYKFEQTGKSVGGRFRQYWEQNGGLTQFGYPITDEFQEKSALDGKTYTVQYFQRAVFELHPENSAPNDVLLSQLGTYQYKAENSLTYTGTTVTLTKRPERIVCLVALCEDILYELGIDPTAVNDTMAQDPAFWGDKGKSFPIISGGFAAPNLEDIAKLKPDLVIGFLPHIGLRDALKPIAPLFIMNPAKYQDSIAYMLEVGHLTGRTYQARISYNRFLHKLASYKAKSPNNRVPLLVFGRSTTFSIFTEGSLFGSVLAAVTNYPWPAPGPNDVGAPDQEPGSLQYSVEKILEKDPDVLLFETQGSGTPLSQQLAVNPIWGELKAVKTGKVYEVRTQFYLFGRGTRSMSLALDDAMAKIYPETFPTPLD